MPAFLRHASLAAIAAQLSCIALAIPADAKAAQSYDSCAGFIDSVPTTISTQGVWCLRKDLSTAVTTGAAIVVAANNVTIDCNDFKLGGLAAGDASQASGIAESGHQNTTVRHCNIRGFWMGISLSGSGGGHLVEDNRLDNNLYVGINAASDGPNIIRRNLVRDTGGATMNPSSYAIYASGDITDNTIIGGFSATPSTIYGIMSGYEGDTGEISNNRVRGLAPSGGNSAYGIFVYSTGVSVAGNRISAVAATPGAGIRGFGATDTICTGNTVMKFAAALLDCQDGGGNASN